MQMQLDSDATMVLVAPSAKRLTSVSTGRFTQAPRHSLPANRAINKHLHGFYKRTFDILGALLLAMLFAPVFLFIVVVLMCSPGRRVLFRHARLGLDGSTFSCLKFESMVPDAEQVLNDVLARDAGLRAEWARDHKLRDDPRITRLGKFLRSTSLDELPQLWNVIRGDMSLVGPRPIVTDEVDKYGRHIAAYLRVKPGLTGLWQVNGRNDNSYRRRVAMDLLYVRHANPVFDTYILLLTARVVLFRHGAY